MRAVAVEQNGKIFALREKSRHDNSSKAEGKSSLDAWKNIHCRREPCNVCQENLRKIKQRRAKQVCTCI
jgi:hypothetical protein